MKNIIERQRTTVNEHLDAENIGDWSAVYETFIQADKAYYDVIPLSTKFKGITGVKDFYEAIATAIPDLYIKVTQEYDVPGCSIREVTIIGTHQGEYCGVPASGNSLRFELAAFYIFDTEDDSGKLLAERIYFDNETLLRQMRGEPNAPYGVGLADVA